MEDFKQYYGWMLITIICLLGCIVLMMALKILRKVVISCKARNRPDETLTKAVIDNERKLGWYGDNRYSMESNGGPSCRKILDACDNKNTEEENPCASCQCARSQAQHLAKESACHKPEASKDGKGVEKVMVPLVLIGKTTLSEKKDTYNTAGTADYAGIDQEDDVLESLVLGKVDIRGLTAEQASYVSKLPIISKDMYDVSKVVPPTGHTQRQDGLTPTSHTQGEDCVDLYDLATAPDKHVAPKAHDQNHQTGHEKPPPNLVDYPYATPCKRKAPGTDADYDLARLDDPEIPDNTSPGTLTDDRQKDYVSITTDF